MSRFDYRKLTSTQRLELVSELLEVLNATKNKGELTTFILQLITPSEAVMLARRWQIAQQLAAGKSYYTIAQELAVGMTTIQSVDQWLSAAIGDYRARLEEAKNKMKQKGRLRRSRVSTLPNTPPFLLLNLVIEGVARSWWQELKNTPE